MKEIESDYSKCSIHELEYLDQNVDRTKYPERAERIRRELEKRKTHPEYLQAIAKAEQERTRFLGKQIVYTNRQYYLTLTASLYFMLLVNLLFLLQGQWLAVLPITIQVMLLLNIYLKRFEQITLIKLWSALMILVGFSGLLSAGCRLLVKATADDPSKYTITDNAYYSLVYLGMGLYFYFKLEKSVEAREPLPLKGATTGNAA
jgi:hypothetical protein